MFNINFSAVIDFLETVKQSSNTALDSVIKIFEDIEAIVDLFTNTPIPTAGPLLHRRFNTIVKNLTIRKALRDPQVKLTWDQVEQIYDQKVTHAVMVQACSECGVTPPLAAEGSGDFKEWLKSIDWAKVLQIVMKILMMILPLLLLAPAPSTAATRFSMNTVEDMKDFYNNNNSRVQSMSRFLISGLEKHGSQVAVNLMNNDPDVAQKMLNEFNK